MLNLKEDQKKILDNYKIQSMSDWDNLDADLIITDPPFGIGFSGKSGIYHRKESNVVDGYIEWKVPEYRERIIELLTCINKNLKPNGQALIFSGWNNSNVIHNEILKFNNLKLRGKMYWSYNFSPYCRLKPSHNIYEIFWVTKGDQWTFKERCSTHHCQKGEPNLTTLRFKRDYKINMPKYPTRLPFKLLQCLLEHFSNEEDLIFDPLGGSGMVGVVSQIINRKFIIGDLNQNGKLVFEHLLDYYLNQNGIEADNAISQWWRKK